jgi:hypothetical protein
MELDIKRMIDNERLTEGSIYNIQFAYNSKLIGYRTLISDILMLFRIPNPDWKSVMQI